MRPTETIETIRVDLFEILRRMLPRHPYLREVGNVQFWQDEAGNVCYDKPVAQWDCKAIAAGIISGH